MSATARQGGPAAQKDMMTRKYRSRMPFVGQLIIGIATVLLGMASADPNVHASVADHVVGAMLIAAGGALVGLASTNGAVLTPAGITYRSNFRRRTIPWDAVKSFEVAPFPENTLWSTVRVQLRPSGHAYTRGVWGTKRYARQLVAEFSAYRAEIDIAGWEDNEPAPSGMTQHR
jgi:hypothetical protein